MLYSQPLRVRPIRVANIYLRVPEATRCERESAPIGAERRTRVVRAASHGDAPRRPALEHRRREEICAGLLAMRVDDDPPSGARTRCRCSTHRRPPRSVARACLRDRKRRSDNSRVRRPANTRVRSLGCQPGDITPESSPTGVGNAPSLSTRTIGLPRPLHVRNARGRNPADAGDPGLELVGHVMHRHAPLARVRRARRARSPSRRATFCCATSCTATCKPLAVGVACTSASAPSFAYSG